MSVLDAPELAPYRDEPKQMPSGAPGKHGVLDMTFARRGDRSLLAHLYREAPLLVQQALYWDEHLPGLPCVYIITTSGCVLQGDRQDVSVTVGENAMAHVTTQAATKVHQMDANFAAASQQLALAENAYLELLPGPVIPHRRSRYITRTEATVAPSATLLSAELLQPGRKHHGAGELFEFDLYSSTLTTNRPDGTPLFTEKLVAEPWRHPARQAGVMGKFDVFANVTLVTPRQHADQIFERVVPGADTSAGCVAGASRLPNEAGLVYKVLGMETEPVKAKVRAFWGLVRQQVLGAPIPPARPWGSPLLQRWWSSMSAGDTAWVLVSAGLVMVMVPGLALFYGGQVSSRNVLVMLQQNIFPLGLISVLWVLAGFSLAFGPDAGGGVIGNLAEFGLRDLAQGPPAGMHAVEPGLAIPGLAFVAYMMMFAIITPALITGATAVAGRGDPPSLDSASRTGRRPALVRLVRLQRGRRPPGERRCRAGRDQHPGRRGRGDARLAAEGTLRRRTRHRAGRRHRRGRGDKSVNSIGANGLFYGGGGHLLGEQALAIVVVVAFSFCLTWIIAITVAKTIGLCVSPADESHLDQVQEGLSAYALGGPADAMRPPDRAVHSPMPEVPSAGATKLITALVDHEDAGELRRLLTEAGAVQIVLSEASLYAQAPRTEVFRGQRRVVEFEPRLRLEVTAAESDAPRVVQAIQRISGAGTYVQVIDTRLPEAVGGSQTPST